MLWTMVNAGFKQVRGTAMTNFLNRFTTLQTRCVVSVAIMLTIILTPNSGWTAEDDCALGARYYQLSNTAKDEFRQQDAYDFLERAVAACPTYYYWQELAELATEFGEPARTERAAEAFVAAHDMATNDPDRARSIARYAELLFHGNDPQNAMTYIVEARNLDPNTQWIADLSEEITSRAANVTAEDIKRGLGDMAFKPLKLQRSLPNVDKATGGGAGGGTTKSSDGQVPDVALVQEEAATRRSINIQLNFVINTTELDATTRNNLKVLAATLADDQFADQRFLLVGHADVVGDAGTNLTLSIRRANAISDAIKALQPSLAQRLETEGRGEQQPFSRGMSAADHRLNRRVEVILLNP